MKFLCDRCKTRYSIGDDRVRGKILKIRCKNCANVITVREGMDAAEADPAVRRRNPTMAAPAVMSSTPNGAPSALNAAFQSALSSKPPAALDEEWYVSIDGEQEGPFSLPQAQAWVAQKPFDADLHCWSEGFDDWLPVDKVSHFRGLRKRAAAPAPTPAAPPPVPSPPPLPRVAAGARIAAQPVEDEPKPLFAATMASLERSAPAASSPGIALPPPTAPRPSATPAGGTPALPAHNGNGTPLAARGGPASGTGARSSVPRAATTPGPGVRIPQFDAGTEGATQIDSPAFDGAFPPFDDDAKTAAEPVAAARRADVNDAFVKAMKAPAAAAPVAPPEPAAPAAATPSVPLSALAANAPLTESTDNDDGDDDLQIGEVSRVVNLADLARSRPQPAAAPVVAQRRSGAIPAMSRTGAVPRLNTTGAIGRIDDPAAVGLEVPPPTEAALIPPPVASTHRRGLFALIGVAALLLAGVIVAVVLFVFDSESVTNNRLSGPGTIDTTRPDDPLRRPGDPPPTNGSGSADPGTSTKPATGGTRPRTNPIKPLDPTPTPPADSLRSDEIEEMARKYSAGTQRCYMRSQKGADGILIGDVKKIQATLDIAPDGTVKSVQLSAHSTNNLGKCLIGTIKTWRFRASPGGLYKISLQFVSS